MRFILTCLVVLSSSSFASITDHHETIKIGTEVLQIEPLGTEEEQLEGFLPFPKEANQDFVDLRKKVFAHYFTPYIPLLDSRMPGEDYYDRNYLNPYGEKAKYLSRGGLLRQRPIYRAPFSDDLDWLAADANYEVRKAAAIGLDGFAMNILSTTTYNWERVLRTYDAAEEVGDFKILIMPDMDAVFKSHPEQFIPMIQTLAKREASFRLDDGRLVIAPYLAERQSPAWWKQTLNELKRLGIQVALVPVYHGWAADIDNFKQQEPAAFNEYVYGASDWGPRAPKGAYGLVNSPDEAHQKGVKWMAPVAPQDYRPKASTYNEAGNSETYRAMWESAINGGADWVHIITWNDYGESTEISPSSQTGYSFYDLTAYYIDWFKTGLQPTIEQDALYAFYREHSTDAVISGNVQTITSIYVNGEKPRNEIELLAFLESPATLEINIAGKTYQQQAGAGITSFKVPLNEGKPDFKIIRNGDIIQQMYGRHTISNNIDVEDFTYHGMSSKRPEMDKNIQHIGWPIKLINGSNNRITNADSISPYARNSNALSTLFTFNNSKNNDGFAYQFIELPDNSTSAIGFDLNIKDACLYQANLVLNLSDSEGNSAISLELCNTNNSSAEIVNRSSTGDEILAGTNLLPNLWYQIEITATNPESGQNSFDLLMTGPNGSKVAHKNLSFKSNAYKLGSIQLILESSIYPEVQVAVDNVYVGLGQKVGEGNNLLSNGSFELPIVVDNNGKYQYYSGSALPGWKIDGNIDLVSKLIWSAADGNQQLDLNGNGRGGITQTVSGLIANGTYTLSFKYASHARGSSSPRTMDVLVNGALLDSLSTTSKVPNYLSASYQVQATSSGNITVKFDSTYSVDSSGMVLDDVQLVGESFSNENTLVNGSFESSVVTDNRGRYQFYSGDGLPGWQIGGNIDLVTSLIWPAPDGHQQLDLNGTGRGSISQTATSLVANGTYTLSFEYARHAGGSSSPRTMDVFVNGVRLDSLSTNSKVPNYLSASYQVQASNAGEITLMFDSTYTAADTGMVLDDVKLVKTGN